MLAEGSTAQEWVAAMLKSAPLQSYEESLREWPYRVYSYEFKTLKDARAFADRANTYIYERRSGHVVCTEEENS